VIWRGREANMEANKARYAQATDARTLADIVKGADVFLGCSTAGVLSGEMVKTMADQPVILALANPEPEIRPEVAKGARPTASSPPAVRTTRTRSTTCSASPTSSAAPSIAARPASPTR
jgi:malic enzyme